MTEFSKRILFIGMPDMALVCLEGFVSAGVNIVGAFGAKKNHPTYSNFKNAVNRLNLNFLEFDNLDDEEFIKEIKLLEPDLAVVCSYNYKIPKVLLDIVKDGFVNVHPSLLPDYRGPNPYSAVLLNMESETGVTLHFMDEKFDTGNIISQKSFEISSFETMGTLFNRLNILALDMLLEMLKSYEQGHLKSEKQPEGKFKISSNLSEDALYLDFTKSAKELDFLIRGLNPFVLARSNFRKTIVKIPSADVIDENFSPTFEAGQITKITEDKFFIATANGLLSPTSMQFGTFFTGSPKEFIQILNPKIGERFS